MVVVGVLLEMRGPAGRARERPRPGVSPAVVLALRRGVSVAARATSAAVEPVSHWCRHVVKEWAPPQGTGILKACAKAVVNALADRGSDEGENMFPGVGRISRETCLDERTVKRVLNHLDAKEVTVVTGQREDTGANIRKFGAWYHARSAKLEQAEGVVSRPGGGGDSSDTGVVSHPPNRSRNRSRTGAGRARPPKPDPEREYVELPTLDELPAIEAEMERKRAELEARKAG